MTYYHLTLTDCRFTIAQEKKMEMNTSESNIGVLYVDRNGFLICKWNDITWVNGIRENEVGLLKWLFEYEA